MNMSIAEGAVTALLGYAVVFFGIVILMFVIMVFGRIMQKKQKPAAAAAPAAPAPAAPAAAPAPKAEPAPGTAGELKLNNVPERDAALVMAVVAYRLGKPLNELRFRSIREITDEKKN